MKKTKLFSFFFAFLLFFSLGAAFIQPAQAASEKKVAEGSVLKKIKKSGELVVGTSADYPPLEFTASENGKTKYVGVDIELAKDIAQDLGVKLVIKNMSFDSLLVALETGKVDMVISAMTPTPERKQSVAFSKIYYKPSGEYFLVNKKDKDKYTSIQSLKGQAIGAQTGSNQYNLVKSQMKDSKLKGLGKINNLVLALQSGKVSASNTFAKYIPYFFKGIWYTIVITVFSVIIGIVLGIILALMRLSKNPILHWLAVCYIEFIRGTPQMVQILFVYFGIGYLISNLSALVAGIIAIGLNSGAYVAEDIRSGIDSLPKGQMEAARSLGLSRQKAFRYVIIPQAIKNIWPALGNEFINLLKDSSLVSVIGVAELMYQTQLVQTSTYKGVLPLFIAMIIYFIMTFSLTRLLNHFEKRMKRNDSND